MNRLRSSKEFTAKRDQNCPLSCRMYHTGLLVMASKWRYQITDELLASTTITNYNQHRWTQLSACTARSRPRLNFTKATKRPPPWVPNTHIILHLKFYNLNTIFTEKYYFSISANTVPHSPPHSCPDESQKAETAFTESDCDQNGSS